MKCERREGFLWDGRISGSPRGSSPRQSNASRLPSNENRWPRSFPPPGRHSERHLRRLMKITQTLITRLLLSAAVFAGLGTGCAATQLNVGAHRVLATRTPAPAGCQYLGTVFGNQGGSFTGPLTSNKRLAEGAMNDIKNQGHALGGNYIVLENSTAGETRRDGSGGQTDVTYTGNVYRCPAV